MSLEQGRGLVGGSTLVAGDHAEAEHGIIKGAGLRNLFPQHGVPLAGGDNLRIPFDGFPDE